MNFLLQNLAAFKTKSNPVPPVNFTGRWKNELESIMELSVNVNGFVTGKYITAVGQPGNTEKFDIVGFASGDLISFIVSFSQYGSMTSWMGQHTARDGKELIYTMWHLAVNIEDAEEQKKLWGSMWTGSNLFERIA